MTYIVTNGVRGSGALRYEIDAPLMEVVKFVNAGIANGGLIQVPAISGDQKPCWVNPDNIVTVYEGT